MVATEKSQTIEERLSKLENRVYNLTSLVIANQNELHNHSIAINKLEVTTLRLEKTIGLTQEA